MPETAKAAGALTPARGVPHAPRSNDATAPVAAQSGPERPLLEVRNLSRRYGNVRAVVDLAFSVGRGEVVGFLGPNGAGKSTTLRIIVGYLAPSEGQVLVAGHDVVEQPEIARRSIGYMPETAPLYPEMRVNEYLAFRARLKQIPRSFVKSGIERVMKKTGIEDVERRLVGSLSRGYRQRVALADALLGDPPLLILDEPTAGLDPNQIRSVRSLLRSLAGKHTVLLSTHILSEVESTCARALVIDRGTLVAEGPIAELRRQSGSQRAVVTIHDREGRGFGLLVAVPGVLGVTPRGGTGSVLPPATSRTADDLSAYGQGSDSVVSYELTFDVGVDPNERLEGVVGILVGSGVAVREARLCQTSLEEVFGQLTGADADEP